MGTLPTDPKARKNAPIARGLLDYFPRACAAVAELSRIGNEQHNPGEPMHWAREKSTDHADCIVRHLIERGTLDTDGQRHATKVAWRGLALLETELEDAAFEAHMNSPAEYLEAIRAIKERIEVDQSAPPGWWPGMATEELGGGSRIEAPPPAAPGAWVADFQAAQRAREEDPEWGHTAPTGADELPTTE